MDSKITDFAIGQLDRIMDCYDGGIYSSELHHNIFNLEYFIDSDTEAESWLNQIGVFDAINEIVQYEKDNYGQVTTDVFSPTKVANMYCYVKGDELLDQIDYYSDVSNNIHDKFLQFYHLLETKSRIYDFIGEDLEVDAETLYNLLNSLDIPCDGYFKVGVIHLEYSINWGAKDKNTYEKVEEELDLLCVKNNAYEVYVLYDVSGYDYWMQRSEEQNYASLTIRFDEVIMYSEVGELVETVREIIGKLEDIQEEHDYNPEGDDLYFRR
jgi:hypothetical protein